MKLESLNRVPCPKGKLGVSAIHSTSKDLLSAYYMPGTMVDAGEIVMVQAGKITFWGVSTHAGSSTVQVNTGSHSNSSPAS